MAVNTRMVKQLPLDQKHLYADRALPKAPQRQSSDSLTTFPARGPRGIESVYIGHGGNLWRMGRERIDRFAGQDSVCRTGTEARWISINALQPYRLTILRYYVYTYKITDATSHLAYIMARMKNLEAQFGTDIIGINLGSFDACFSSDLEELIKSIHDRLGFLRKLTEKAIIGGPVTGYSDEHLWLSYISLDRQINEYLHLQSKWLEMQYRPEPEPVASCPCTALICIPQEQLVMYREKGYEPARS